MLNLAQPLAAQLPNDRTQDSVRDVSLVKKTVCKFHNVDERMFGRTDGTMQKSENESRQC